MEPIATDLEERSRLRHGRLLRLGLLLLITTATGFAADQRLGHAGGWLPTIPNALPGWQGRDAPMDWTFVDAPRYLSRIYENTFGETVQTFVIAPQSSYGYRDPRGCLRGSGYVVTGERTVRLGAGADSTARLLVLRNDTIRLIMCYWMQTREGAVSAEAPVFAYHAGTRAFTELQLVARSLLSPRPSCLIRVYTPIESNDPQGRQAQRNVMEIARKVYKAIKSQG